MNDNITPVEKLFEKAENYSKTTIELFRLNATDKSADIISSLAIQFAIFMVITFFALIITIGIALWLGELLGKFYYGFFALAGGYALIAALLYSFRNQWIKAPVSNLILTHMLKKRII